MLLLCALLVGVSNLWAQAPVNTTLWEETWTGGDAAETPSAYGFEGTTVYGGATLTYDQSSTNTKLYAEVLAGGTSPELLLSKNNQTWTISNIPTGQATEMSLTFLSNKTTYEVTSSTTGITISGSQKSWTISATGSVTSFDLTIKNTGSSNARIDNIRLKVTTAGTGGLTASDLALTGAPVALSFDLYNNSEAQTVTFTTSSTGAVTVSGGEGYVTTAVSGNTITVTPTAVTPSAQTITVSQAADANYAAGSVTFTVFIDDSTPLPTHTATFSINGTTSSQDFEEGAAIVFPGDPADISGKSFVGWVTEAISGVTDTAPSLVTSATMGNSDVTYYAVFADVVQGSETIETLTYDASSQDNGFPTSYAASTDYDLAGVSFNITQIYDNNNYFQWRAQGNSNGTGAMYNNDALNVQTVVITYTDGDNNKNISLKVGDVANPTGGTSITPSSSGNVYTFDCSGNNKEYFVLTNGTGAGYTSSIVITYKTGTPNTYSGYCTTVVAAAVETPTIVLGANPFLFSTSVSFTCATAGATIWYSFDGTNWTEYVPAPVDMTINETTTIYAKAIKDNEESAVAQVIATKNLAVPTVTIDATGITNTNVYVGTAAGSLAATVTYEDAAISGALVTWSGNNDEVATIDATTGVVTLVAAGSVTFTATYAGNSDYSEKTATYVMTVTNSDPTAPGSENNPYTVAQARAAVDAGAGVTGVYATGIVSEIVTAYSSQHGNISYNISADGLTTSDQLQAYRGKSYNGENFTSADDIQVGDVVVIYGNLTKYNSTYEFASNNQLVSLVRTVATPTFTPAAGEYTSAQSVVISCATEGATIYYTTDGTDPFSDPTAAPNEYNGAIAVDADMTIKAVAVKSGYEDSNIAVAVYTIITTPVINADDIQLAYDATSGEINYTIDNEVPGNALDATTTASWISNIEIGVGTVPGAGIVSFTTTANTDPASRTATVTLTYGSISKDVTVTQAGLVPSITIAPAVVNVNAVVGSEAITSSITTVGLAGDWQDLSIQYYNANGDEISKPDWFGTTFIHYDELVLDIQDNTSSDARTGYLKVYGVDANNNTIYSDLVTVNQAGFVVDYATLPFEWVGGSSADFTALNGVTASGLGSDYAASNAPYLVKLDGTGDYIQVKTDSQPGKVTIGVKMIGGANESTITVQESADGVTFTDVQGLSISGTQNSILSLETTNAFAETTRYVRLYFTKGSNVGVGPITITKMTPSITIDPAVVNVNAVVGSEAITSTITTVGLAGDWQDLRIQYYNADGDEISKPDWFGTTFIHYNDLVLDIQDNTSSDARTGYLKVYGESISGETIYSDLVTVNQAGFVPSITIDPAVVNVNAVVGSEAITSTITTVGLAGDWQDLRIQYYNADGDEISKPDWFGMTFIHHEELVLDIQDNTSSEARTGYLKLYGVDANNNTIYSNLVTVNQAGLVIDYATLPFRWVGGSSADFTALNGVTASGLGSDYAASNAPYLVKLDGTGDYIEVKTDVQPAKVIIGVKMLGGSYTSTITVQESEDGQTFSDVEDLTIAGVQNDVLTLTTKMDFEPETRYIRLYFTKGSNVGVGPITITKNSTDPIDITLNAYGYATYCSEYPLDFTTTDGYTAWYITDIASDGKITFSKIKGAIEAAQGVLLYDKDVDPTGASNVTLTRASGGTELRGNLLVGAWYPTSVKAQTVYGLTDNKFVINNAAGTIPAGKAYLLANSVPANVKSFTFVFEDEATGIIETRPATREEVEAIFNLGGQRMNKMQRGVNIVNGKKVLVK